MTLSYKIAALAKQINACTNVSQLDMCFKKALRIGLPQPIAFSLRAIRATELWDKHINIAKNK